MNPSSYQIMDRLVRKHISDTSGKVLDVGSYDVNGTYRPIFEGVGWDYTGLDMAAGPNVDIVASDVYAWEVESSAYNAVISGSTFEHVEFFWLTFLEMARVIKKDGIIILNVPTWGYQHRYPADCWRFYPDGYCALAKWTGLEVLEVTNPWQVDKELKARTMRMWGEAAGVFRKTDEKINENIGTLQSAVRSYLQEVSKIEISTNYPDVLAPDSDNSYLSPKNILMDTPLKTILSVAAKKILRKAKLR